MVVFTLRWEDHKFIVVDQQKNPKNVNGFKVIYLDSSSLGLKSCRLMHLWSWFVFSWIRYPKTSIIICYRWRTNTRWMTFPIHWVQFYYLKLDLVSPANTLFKNMSEILLRQMTSLLQQGMKKSEVQFQNEIYASQEVFHKMAVTMGLDVMETPIRKYLSYPFKENNGETMRTLWYWTEWI